MARKYTAILDSFEKELDIYLEHTNTDGKDLDELRSKYRRRRILENYDAHVVGSRLKEERKLSGLTQKEVADAMGVSYQTICLWETGRVDLTLRDAHRLMALYRRFPGSREEGVEANLNYLCWTPMDYLGGPDWERKIS